MEPVVRYGLIAGAISSEVMVLLVLVNTILIRDYFGPQSSAAGWFGIWNIVYPLLVIIIFELGGIFSARIGRRNLVAGKDALITGFITGITTGIILEVMWFSQIISLVAHTGTVLPVESGGIGITLLTIALLLVLVVMGGVLSAFGSYMYASRAIPGS